MREKIEPKPMVRKPPKYESDRNAPKIGAKFVATVQGKIMFVPLATPILQSLIRYSIIFGMKP